MIDQLSSTGFAVLGYTVALTLLLGYGLALWAGHRAADRKAARRGGRPS